MFPLVWEGGEEDGMQVLHICSLPHTMSLETGLSRSSVSPVQ